MEGEGFLTVIDNVFVVVSEPKMLAIMAVWGKMDSKVHKKLLSS